MKKKIKKTYSTNDLATKTDVNRINMNLKATEKRLTNDLRSVENRLNKRMDRMFTYIDFKIKPLEEMARDYGDFKNKIFDRLDWLIGRYKKFEEEYTVQAEQNRRILDRLENHEERIVTVEKSFRHN